MSLVFLLLRLLTADPIEASAWVAQNDSDLREFLDRTGQRESWNTWIGPHERDRWHEPAVYRRAVAAGYLHPGLCPGHSAPRGWSTRGTYGLMAGFAWRYLPWWARCFPPSILDLPIVGAWVTKKRREHLCSSKRAMRCRQWCRPDARLAPCK